MKAKSYSIYKKAITPLLLIVFICTGSIYKAKSQQLVKSGYSIVEKIVSIGKLTYMDKFEEIKKEKSSIFKYNLNFLIKSLEMYKKKKVQKKNIKRKKILK